jgi:hypothetical protein
MIVGVRWGESDDGGNGNVSEYILGIDGFVIIGEGDLIVARGIMAMQVVVICPLTMEDICEVFIVMRFATRRWWRGWGG